LRVTINRVWNGEASSAIPQFRHPLATTIAKDSATATSQPLLTSAKTTIATNLPRSTQRLPVPASKSWEAVSSSFH
jgi:hypothetical protein